MQNTSFSGYPIIRQLLSYISKTEVNRTAEKHAADRYSKRFKTWDHLVTMLFAAISGCSSLRELEGVILACEGKLEHLQLKSPPKRSTLADANKRRSSQVFADIYYGLIERYKSVLSDSSIKTAVKNLLIVDSTTISLFSDVLKGAGRNPINGKKKGGIKAHVMISALMDLPTLINFSSAATHDHVFLQELGSLNKGTFLVFDKAYVDYYQYAEWTKQGVYFVTRLKDNAVYERIEENELDESVDSRILIDEKVRLNKKDNTSIELRRIAFYDEEKHKTYVFITNNFELKADKVTAIYKNRWQIETMFKRLKQNFPLKYFLGDSQNAIEIQIWASLIMQLILQVIKHKLTKNWAFSNLVSIVRYHLTSYINLIKFLENPNRSWEELRTKPPDQPELFPD